MPLTQHQERTARKQELRAKGQRPTKPTYAVRVEPSVTAIPEWARKRAVKGLSTGSTYVWLRRSDAWMLAQLDREDGGRPQILRVEYRACPVCKRMLLGELAKERRMKNESCATGDQKPCSDDCLPAHWRRRERQ